jgi:hypothetical protein
MKIKPSIGILISGWLLIVYSTVYLGKITLFLITHGFASFTFPDPAPKILWLILILICGIFLLRLADLARIITLVIVSANMLVSFMGALFVLHLNEARVNIQQLLQHAVIFIVSFSILYYLTRPKVAEQFSQVHEITGAQEKQVSGIATASVIFAFLSIIPMFWLFGLLAVVLGIIAWVKIAKNRQNLKGINLALGGIIIGSLTVAFALFFLILLFIGYDA